MIAPRSLADLLSSKFARVIQQRGAAYHDSGRVKIVDSTDKLVQATVKGTENYDVTLMHNAGRMQVSCTCPYADDSLCKHMWAVILAADKRKLLQGNGSNRSLRLVHMEADDEYVEEDEFEADWHALDDEDNDNDDDDEQVITRSAHAKITASKSLPVPAKGKPKPPHWRTQLAQLTMQPAVFHSEPWPANRELLYVLDVGSMGEGYAMSVQLVTRDRKQNGEWSKPRTRTLQREWIHQIPDANDRHILSLLGGANPEFGSGSYGHPNYMYQGALLHTRFQLHASQQALILPLLCHSGRCRIQLRSQDEDSQWLAVNWDDGEPWQLRMQVRHDGEQHYALTGALWRGEQRMEPAELLALLRSGLVFTRTAVARVAGNGIFNWVALLRKQSALRVPESQSDEFMVTLLRQNDLPPLDLPPELHYAEVQFKPRPRLTIKPSSKSWERDRLLGELAFDYDGKMVAYNDVGRGIVQQASRQVLLRNHVDEQQSLAHLVASGWRKSPAHTMFELPAKRLPQAVSELSAAGWHVEAQGKIYRSPGQFTFAVSSGIDWFELHATVEFDGMIAQLPKLLEAMQRGENTVKLDDGSLGILPEAWLRKYGVFAALGARQDDHLRFKRSQAGLLDALLAEQPQATWDAAFVQARAAIQQFSGVQPMTSPAGFKGELRPYQCDGLGWLHFLQKFGFGGCLADDMGLGKTVQVLALLESRRELRQHNSRIGPSLVVLPKSLMFNWKQEAARFAPQLRVLDHTGHQRLKGNKHFNDHDLLLTTYGTLRNDAEDFKDVCFDYVILDEAQAIKNAASESAKAARLLKADHRLALSGTPVENHLGELWSLCEFLNPGLLGAASVFKQTQGVMRNPDESTSQLLARAVRPFILRRTKSQVLSELPPKVEQTLYCELDTKQRKQYDELRNHYRSSLQERIDSVGLARAKIQILEALLRLRQAAIHPGLIDKRRVRESSAKLEVLLPQLREVVDEGHKTLVFSQFTSMLAIVRQHLDREGIRYEYLDGKTRDREACVTRFQTNDDCKLFLISLKAGGTGLNLTAAQYVVLLDPWWNPAVEAQAIDRAHRIGQVNQVFAYRIIARDTIEEKVLQLQNTKRELADAILGGDNSLIRTLGKEDLALLLS